MSSFEVCVRCVLCFVLLLIASVVPLAGSWVLLWLVPDHARPQAVWEAGVFGSGFMLFLVLCIAAVFVAVPKNQTP